MLRSIVIGGTRLITGDYKHGDSHDLGYIYKQNDVFVYLISIGFMNKPVYSLHNLMIKSKPITNFPLKQTDLSNLK